MTLVLEFSSAYMLIEADILAGYVEPMIRVPDKPVSCVFPDSYVPSRIYLG